MESTITGMVGEVTGRTVNTSKGQAPIFDVTIGSTKASTFKAPIAEEAKALQGSTVEATVNVTERNGYTNYTLLGVKLVDAGGTQTGVHLSGNASAPVSVAPVGVNDDTAARIARSVAFEHMPQYIEVTGFNEDELYEQLNNFARWIYNGATPQREAVAVTAEPTEKDDGVPW